MVLCVFAESKSRRSVNLWYLRAGLVFGAGVLILSNKEFVESNKAFALVCGILAVVIPVVLVLFRFHQARRSRREFRPSPFSLGTASFTIAARSSNVPYTKVSLFRWIVGEECDALDLQSEDGNFEFVGVPKSVDKTLVTTFLESKGLRMLSESSDPETYLRQKLKRVEEEFIQKMHSQIHGS